jgi:GTP:adenosylcobinamide-phosphate guanylyltransferase
MSRTARLVVLCGGLGTRMASVTIAQKCLVQVAGRPFLGHVLDAAARPGTGNSRDPALMSDPNVKIGITKT